MTRFLLDCRDYPSEMKCSVAISADTEQELLDAAVQHAVDVHGHADSSELRGSLAQMITAVQDTSPARGRAVGAFNAVRFRVKEERGQQFLDAHNAIGSTWPGLTHANIIKTGDSTYCIIAEWPDMEACIAARPNMIATLDSFRDVLEDLGGGRGVTDPVAGPVVLSLK